MGLPTVAEVIEMPALRAARPSVVAGSQHLDREVRWVHAAELEDIADLLRGGELVLTTGIALPADDAGLARYASSLAMVGASGLMVEMGRRWGTDLPRALIDACETKDLPLVALKYETRFVTVTQAVGELIVESQVSELRAAEQVHETFTRLSVDAVTPKDILDAVQQMSGLPVVLESDQHRPLEFNAGPERASSLLNDWELTSRRVDLAERTGYDPSTSWLVTRVETRGRAWGRLVLITSHHPENRLTVLIERAAAALALHRLDSRDQENRTRRTHHELVLALLSPTPPADIIQRCEVAGFTMMRRRFVALSARSIVAEDAHETSTADALAWCVRIAAEQGLPVLACTIDRDVRIVLSLPAVGNADTLVDTFAERLDKVTVLRVASGQVVRTPDSISVSLREAQHVLDSVRDNSGGHILHRLEDVHVRGLLALLGDDERLEDFVRREIDPLREHDRSSPLGLLDAVTALVQSSDKSEAAELLNLSRPAFYARLARAQQILGVDLDEPETRMSLHLAVLAHQLRKVRRP